MFLKGGIYKRYLIAFMCLVVLTTLYSFFEYYDGYRTKYPTHHNKPGNFKDVDGFRVDQQMPPVSNIQQSEQVEKRRPVDIYTDDILINASREKAHPGEMDAKANYRYNVQWNNGTDPPNHHVTVLYVPFSHIDPGWLKTFDKYLESDIDQILSGLVRNLPGNPDWTYSISEMVVLQAWMKRGTGKGVKVLQELAKRGQLEITTGGWVMTDEASPTYTAILDQMIEGQMWAKGHLGVNITSAWSVDPFGHSSTMPYLLKKSGMHSMLINRIHQYQKKYLAEDKSMEFTWRQPWDSDGVHDMTTYVLPKEFYTWNEQCGPDENICWFTAFNSHQHQYMPLTESGLDMIGRELTKQYRKKAMLFRHNVVLIPYGEDFAYRKNNDWVYNYGNLTKIFKYINSKKDLNCTIKFGTLSEYFDLVPQALKDQNKKLSVVSGDFYSYSDSGPQYWVGYFTSRPHHKRRGRELERLVITADALMSVQLNSKLRPNLMTMKHIADNLTEARRGLALFQHHDAVTGTSNIDVMEDYLNSLNKGIISVATALSQLLLPKVNAPGILPLSLNSDPLFLAQEKKTPPIISIFNPSHFPRTEIVRLRVESSCLLVQSESGEQPPVQLNPVFTDSLTVSKTQFELFVLVKVEPFSLKEYMVYYKESGCDKTILASHRMVNPTASDDPDNFKTENTYTVSDALVLQVQNDSVIVEFGSSLIELSFLRWITDRGGAYVFYRYKEPFRLPVLPGVIIAEGPLLTSVLLNYTGVNQELTFFKAGVLKREVMITNKVNVAKIEKSPVFNTEISMEVKYLFDFNPTLYTDSNSFQMIRRKYMNHLPWESNIYPISSLAYLDDGCDRLTLLSRQPHGISHDINETRLHVFLDRHYYTQDGKGMDEPLQERTETTSEFLLRLKYRTSQACAKIANTSNGKQYEPRLTFPSLSTVVLNEIFQKPLLLALPQKALSPFHVQQNVTSVPPCFVMPVLQRIIRVRGSIYYVGLILRDTIYDEDFTTADVLTKCTADNSPVSFKPFMRVDLASTVWKTSLTFMTRGDIISLNTVLQIPRGELESYEIVFELPN